MNINQHNYEEFFLLYVDNELSAADRQAVEQFAQANPDLAIELEMLQQMRLPVEELLFDEKPLLYRNESDGITLANHEEQFLLYVDNELNSAEKEKVETFVLQHPALQDSFTLLKQTRLELEPVLFADKPSLYRHEKKERRVFYIGWQRLAVAAALIGLVVLIWNVVPADKTASQTTAGISPANTPAVSNGAVDPVKTVPAVTQPISDNIAFVNTGSTGSGKPQTIANAAVDNDPTTDPAKNELPVRVIETQKQDVVAATTHSGFDTAPTTTLSVSGDNANVEHADIKAPMAPDGSSAGNNDNIQPAVYRELDTEDEKKSLLLGSLEINKDKLRGFFRKAGSLFRSKAKTEEDKTERPTTKSK